MEKRNRGGKWRLGSAYLVFLARPGLSFPRPLLARLVPPSLSPVLRCLLTLCLPASPEGHLPPPISSSSSFRPHLPPYWHSLIVMRTLGLSPAGARAPCVPVFSCSAPRFHVIAVLIFILSRSSSLLPPSRSVAYVCFPISCFIFSATASIVVLQAITIVFYPALEPR